MSWDDGDDWYRWIQRLQSWNIPIANVPAAGGWGLLAETLRSRSRTGYYQLGKDNGGKHMHMRLGCQRCAACVELSFDSPGTPDNPKAIDTMQRLNAALVHFLWTSQEQELYNVVPGQFAATCTVERNAPGSVLKLVDADDADAAWGTWTGV